MQMYRKQINKEISCAKQFIGVLPKYHWFNHIKANELDAMENVGIYDMLLHKRDIAYSMLNLYEWVRASGFNIIDFSQALNRGTLSLELQVPEIVLYNVLKKATIENQKGMTELMCGHIFKHSIYVSFNKETKASVTATGNLLFCHGSPIGLRNIIEESYGNKKVRNEIFIAGKLIDTFLDDEVPSLIPYMNEHVPYGGRMVNFMFPFTEFNIFVAIELTKKPCKAMKINQLIDTFKFRSGSNRTIKHFQTELTILFSYLEKTGAFLLKHKSVKPFPKTVHKNMFRSIKNNKHEK